MIRRTLALSFGIMKATDLAKEITIRVVGAAPYPYLKSAFAVGLSVAAGRAYGDTRKDKVYLACEVAGLSAVLHEGYALLSSGADRNKTIFVERKATAAARSMHGPRVPPIPGN